MLSSFRLFFAIMDGKVGSERDILSNAHSIKQIFSSIPGTIMQDIPEASFSIWQSRSGAIWFIIDTNTEALTNWATLWTKKDSPPLTS